MVVVRLPKSLVSPLQDCLTPYILTSITPPRSKNLVIEGPKRLLQRYLPLAEVVIAVAVFAAVSAAKRSFEPRSVFIESNRDACCG